MSYLKISSCSICVFLVSVISFSQENFESLGETGFAINHSVSDNYRVNFSTRSRYFLYKDSEFTFKNRQIDIVHFSTYNLAYNKSLSLGIQYRFRESFDGGSNELRITQQYNYIKKRLALRYGHRFRFEQRILENITILRSRYRFALDFPLNGEKLDVGEGYLVASTEALLSLSKRTSPEIDHRATAQIGWLMNDSLKFQAGLEYRFEAFNIATEQRLFILTSAILKL